METAETQTPRCPHFGVCGGCRLQHLAYGAQLAQKAAQLRTLLATEGLSFRGAGEESAASPLPELQLHSSPPYAYRNRIRLTLAESGGTLRTGYLGSGAEENDEDGRAAWRRDAHSSFVPIAQCPIAAPILWRAAEAFLALANAGSATWLGDARTVPDQLELFTTADESRLQLTLFLRIAGKSLPANFASDFTALCEALRARVPELTGAGIALLPARSAPRSRRAELPRPGPAWGAPGLGYAVAPLEPRTSDRASETYWVPRGAFFQVNRFLLPELLALVAEHAGRAAGQSAGLAWDLYAGVGLFARALAGRFAEVTAVEIAEPAASALAATKLRNLRAVKATTLDFLRAAVLQRERPELIVLDPPRTGAGREVCELLARIGAPTLVFVSCSPETLPADLAGLVASGYTLAELHLVDLFPQTTHIETVVILTRDRKHMPNRAPV